MHDGTFRVDNTLPTTLKTITSSTTTAEDVVNNSSVNKCSDKNATSVSSLRRFDKTDPAVAGLGYSYSITTGDLEHMLTWLTTPVFFQPRAATRFQRYLLFRVFWPNTSTYYRPT